MKEPACPRSPNSANAQANLLARHADKATFPTLWNVTILFYSKLAGLGYNSNWGSFRKEHHGQIRITSKIVEERATTMTAHRLSEGKFFVFESVSAMYSNSSSSQVQHLPNYF